MLVFSKPSTLRSTLLVPTLVLATGAALASDGAGQTDLTLEFGGSQVGPPVGMEGEVARFVVGGLRARHYLPGGSGIFGSVLFGQTLDDETGGSFLSGIAGGTFASRWTPTWTGSLEGRVLGYGTQSPFPYRAFAAEGGATLRYRSRAVGVAVAGLGGLGRSQLELRRRADGPSRVFEDDLWRYGGSAELMVGPMTSSVGVVAGLHDTPEGFYRSAGGRLVFAGVWGLAELRLDVWKTPDATETIGGLALIIPIGRAWSARGFFGRTDPDPLTLAQPGSGGGGLLIGRDLLPGRAESRAASGPFEILEYGERTSRVRLTVAADSATTVQLLGDFTLWEPVSMERDNDRWYAEIDVPPGTHHFGFLVDDEWYVPDDAPDVVPDEWGRLSAILVIEGVSK